MRPSPFHGPGIRCLLIVAHRPHGEKHGPATDASAWLTARLWVLNLRCLGGPLNVFIVDFSGFSTSVRPSASPPLTSRPLLLSRHLSTSFHTLVQSRVCFPHLLILHLDPCRVGSEGVGVCSGRSSGETKNDSWSRNLAAADRQMIVPPTN